MRLIIFAKVPGRVELIPLDIIDNRNAGEVLRDILILSKLESSRKEVIDVYDLVKGNANLNLNCNLTENHVKNGDLLEVIRHSKPVPVAAKPITFEKIDLQEEQLGSIVEEIHNSKKKSPSKSTPHNLPGKKIDFD